jgi:serine/threonine protein kinase
MADSDGSLTPSSADDPESQTRSVQSGESAASGGSEGGSIPGTAMPPAETVDLGQQLGTNYRVFDLLGRGAMGEVRRGRTSTGESVAVKLLRPELAEDPSMVTRFLQERSILTGLSHPNIVRVRDLVAEGSTLAIVMDLVDGPDLRTELTTRGTLPAAEAAAVTASVLRGLAAVHGSGVVHRDVKPENVLLEAQAPPAPSVPKLTDFGVSKLLSHERTVRRTSVIGTPDYMAPELIDDPEPTVASDLYSVGIMLYELLCGVTPFAGGSALAVLRKHAELVPGRPPGLPDSLWAVISELLRKDPAQRPSSAALVAVSLESQLASLAATPALTPLVEPPPPDADGATMLNKLTPTVAESVPGAAGRSRRKLVIGAAIAAVVLVGGVATALAAPWSNSKAASVSAVRPTTGLATPTSTTTGDSTATTSASPTGAVTTGEPTTASAGSLPDLSGKTLSEAVATLGELGVSYEVKDVIDPKAAENTVVGQVPAAGQPAGPKVIISVARTAVATLLADVGTVGNSPDLGPVRISGKDYAHGLSASTSCNSPQNWEYDLGRSYRQLTGVVGLTDTSSRSAALQVELTVDGRQIWSNNVSLGKPQPLKVDVSSGLRLVITTTTISCSSDGVDTRVALGDPQLLGVPSEVPTAAATP